MKLWIPLGAINALISIAMGAFGAHALREHIPAARLQTFETAARYHMYHALGLILVGVVASQRGTSGNVAGSSMLAGIVLFSGSLYVLSLTGITALGAITPLGGLAFMIGWGALAWTAWR